MNSLRNTCLQRVKATSELKFNITPRGRNILEPGEPLWFHIDPELLFDATINFLLEDNSDIYTSKKLESVIVHNVNLCAWLIPAWVSLLCDSPLGLKPIKVLTKFFKELNRDPYKTALDYAALGSLLEKSLVYDSKGLPTRGSFCIRPYRKQPVFPEIKRFFVQFDSESLKYVLTFLMFGKKAGFSNPMLEATAFHEWLVLEEELAKLVLPDWVGNLRPIISWLLSIPAGRPDLPHTFFPSHGNGSVAEIGIKTILSKNLVLEWNAKLKRVFSPCLANPDRFIPELREFLAEPSAHDSARSNTARLTFVPKTVDAVRAICMEPVTKQYAQQAVKDWLYILFKIARIKNAVRLDDQGFNCEAACRGSMDGTYDTIDSSKASDTITTELVRRVFPAWLLKYLIGTRSKFVLLPNGDTIEPNKFSPMGSATCFPVQTLLFCAAAYYAGLCTYYNEALDDPTFWERHDPKLIGIAFRSPARAGEEICRPRVFGDDIVCDATTTTSLMSILEAIGFIPNKNKSFIGKQSAYRESCGGFYFAGHDVTPLRFKLKARELLPDGLSPKFLAAAIEFHNRAYRYGYDNLVRTLRRLILHQKLEGLPRPAEHVKNPILFSIDEDESFALLCSRPQNDHLKRRTFDLGYIPTVNDVLLQGDVPTHHLFQRDEVASIKGRTVVEEDDIVHHIQLGDTRVALKYDSKELAMLKHGSYFYNVWAGTQFARMQLELHGGELNESISFGEPKYTTFALRWTPVPC